MENYKEELETLREYAGKKQYIPLSKIIEVFKDPSEEILDEVIRLLENENIFIESSENLIDSLENLY